MNVYVDIVSPGNALIHGSDFDAYTTRQGGMIHVFVTGTDEFIGVTRSYKGAGRVAALHHGHTNHNVIVERES